MQRKAKKKENGGFRKSRTHRRCNPGGSWGHVLKGLGRHAPGFSFALLVTETRECVQALR